MGTNTGERIGILGGTFDPPHLGHLIVADQVLRALDLDRVLLVPANEPWQKVGIRPITSAEKRLIMTRDAIGDADGLAVSDIELRLGGPSYTSVTLDALAENHPETEWRIIVGADAAAGLDTWHNVEKLRTQADIVVVNRPGADFQPPTGWSWELVEIPAVNISGTGLRRRVSQGRSIRFLTPNAVIDHIDSWDLYRGGP
ncbi:MAG: nicotinate-nucleotide adenylyltransferase [Acidimicrobiia bacterium]|nr:nicotinate-nucleotide adenylyltransferase [Acidimicrobiia bacterium]